MSEELPKLDLLIKLMNMTNSEDTMTLVAIRKANAMLKAEGWDWDKLLRSKVKIITNPFASGVGAPIAPTARAAPRAAAPPPPPPQPAQPAVNPWPAGRKPQPQPQPHYSNPPPPRATAPVGPIHFRKSSKDKWCIAFHIALTTGDMVQIAKKDGSSTTEQVGLYVERAPSGHYLYAINKASKYKQKYAGGAPDINDFSL